MSTGGWSETGLARMRAVLARHVEAGDVPGLIAVVSRRGEARIEVMGTRSLDGPDPMRPNTLFRISSMTKPITAVAAMVLVEECVLRLDEPVDRWLPELADRRVLARVDGPLDDTVPAHRPITLRDLLTFRLGLGMVFGPEPYPIHRAIEELDLVGFGPPRPDAPLDPDEWIRRLGTLPLMYQPGERWLYNTGSSILGVLIARAAGQPLETFLRERIFGPLGMTDTGFAVRRDRLHRLASAYTPDPQTGELTRIDGGEDSVFRDPPAFPDAGAGLVSTAADYLAFGEMLLNSGRCRSGRILSRPSVELMTTDQLTPAQKRVSGLVPGAFDHRGWGFGVMLTTGRDGPASVGRYGWDGGYGTAWAVDPAEELTAILLTQVLQFPTESTTYLDFWTSVYQAIDD